MKAAYRRGTEILFQDEPERELRHGEIRVRVKACGICGTDLQIVPGAEASLKKMTGHEVAGEICELGPGVADVSLGEQIVLDSSTPCGSCDACRNAQQELCSDVKSFFHLGSFGFAARMIAPAISAIPCRDLSADVACLQEPLGVAIDMVRLADLVAGRSNVLILGQGPIGLMATALARRAGVRRIFATQHKGRNLRIRLSRQLGADECFDPSETPVQSFNFGCAIDRVLVTAPPATLNDAFAAAAKGAIISFIGIAHGAGAFVNFDANAFHFKKLQLRASFASPAQFGPLALQYFREGIIDGESLISHRFPLEQMPAAVKAAQGDSLKVVVNP